MGVEVKRDGRDRMLEALYCRDWYLLSRLSGKGKVWGFKEVREEGG